MSEDYGVLRDDWPTRLAATALEPVVRSLKLSIGPGLLVSAMRAHGLVPLYIDDVQQLGGKANVCTWDRTGAVCPYCRCGRKGCDEHRL